jgi:hypothetical protein
MIYKAIIKGDIDVLTDDGYKSERGVVGVITRLTKRALVKEVESFKKGYKEMHPKETVVVKYVEEKE